MGGALGWAKPHAMGPSARYETGDVAKICRAMEAHGGWSVDPLVVNIGGVAWRPHLLHADGALGHVHAAEQLATAWIDRIRKARASGRKVVLVAPTDCWYQQEVLLLCIEESVEPVVAELENGEWSVTAYRSAADLVGLRRLKLTPDTLRTGARLLLEQAHHADTSFNKGRSFEDALVLLFSQINGFEVHAHNYRNETEEIDVIVRNTTVGGVFPSTPLVIVSAKNTAAPVDVGALACLYEYMDNRRGACKLGFLCSAGDIASTVRKREHRHATENKVVVLLDGADLADMVTRAHELDMVVQKHVMDAYLE